MNHVRRRSDGSVKSHTTRRQIACDFRTSSFGRWRRCELLKRTFVEQARGKLDDRWWSMKVTGKFFPGPKPFAKSCRLLALAREVLKKVRFSHIRIQRVVIKGTKVPSKVRMNEGTNKVLSFVQEGTKTEAGARSAALWQAWAILESREGNSDQARKLFQCGLVVDPNNRYVWLSWAVFEARQGFADRARSLLTRGCKLNPGDPPLLQALARLEAAEGNMTTARILFEQGTKLDPLHQANWQAWALAEWKHGDIDYARELLQRGVWVSPHSKNASKLFQAWGVLEERDGNVALARQLYKCGIRADPTSEELLFCMSLV